jgi:hypothetical protein
VTLTGLDWDAILAEVRDELGLIANRCLAMNFYWKTVPSPQAAWVAS